jgi:hypothetical protein
MEQKTNLFQVCLFKEQLMTDLITDQRIVRLLINQGENALNTEVANPIQFINKNIFPRKKSLELIEKDTGTISMEISTGSMGETYNGYSLTLFCLFPEAMSYVLFNGIRVVREDLLAHFLSEALKQSRDYGIGKLAFKAVRPLEADGGFAGCAIFFATVDFA